MTLNNSLYAENESFDLQSMLIIGHKCDDKYKQGNQSVTGDSVYIECIDLDEVEFDEVL